MNARKYGFRWQCGILLALCTFALAVNWQCLTFDMMYVEQPLLYGANQAIHSLSDLWQVYLHPHFLEWAIPFFRPSGHFLIYQLLTPLFGWHNTRALLAVNLLFLAGSGFVMTKLYRLIFPGLKWGGYVAFAVYLMQPAMILARLTIMHFEFAYVFFVLLSWYCFASFCQKNQLQWRNILTTKIRCHHFHLLASSMLWYVVAVTFKEPAVMLAPVLAGYFLLTLYHGQSVKPFLTAIFKQKELRQILLLLTALSIALAFYLIMPWPSLSHPLRSKTVGVQLLGTLNVFLKVLFNVQYDFISRTDFQFSHNPYLTFAVPLMTRIITWLLLAVTFASVFVNSYYRKSLLVLLIALSIFLILPLAWAQGMPWHLSLSLVCLSLMMGFGVEILLRNSVCVIGIAVLIGLTTFFVNQQNIKNYLQGTNGFILKLNHNAVFQPPALNLNADSVLVVEDAMGAGDYLLGDSTYPFSELVAVKLDFQNLALQQRSVFLKMQPVYNGSLFRWAYQMPDLKEEVYPFAIAKISAVSDLTLRDWLQHINNIFCVGYDQEGAWHDRTTIFKQQLLREKTRRHFVIKQYHPLAAIVLQGRLMQRQNLPYPDVAICKAMCDKAHRCAGFTYLEATTADIKAGQCLFYQKLAQTQGHACKICTGYIKIA